MQKMPTFSELIEEFGASSLARDLGIPPVNVHSWKTRDSIPSAHWLALVDVAGRRGMRLSLERLAEMAEIRGRDK